jgi:hypothetical protein
MASGADWTWKVSPYNAPWESDPPEMLLPTLDTISSGVCWLEIQGAFVTIAAPSRNIP